MSVTNNLVKLKNRKQFYVDSDKYALTHEAMKHVDQAVNRSYKYHEQVLENLELLESAINMIPEFNYPFIRQACMEMIMRNSMACMEGVVFDEV